MFPTESAPPNHSLNYGAASKRRLAAVVHKNGLLRASVKQVPFVPPPFRPERTRFPPPPPSLLTFFQHVVVRSLFSYPHIRTSKMKFSVTTLAAVLAAALVQAGPVEKRATLDVYVPLITWPIEGTVWSTGSTYNVTWDVSKPPKQITNKKGKVVLSKGGVLDYAHPLADGFDILDGKVDVTIPSNTSVGQDYTVVLFGDSGNNSPVFNIVA
ncbi:hypothetical protein HGRIS_004487 [Hohenbuehelia grisea]|uniref:Yeast cell wall synthesis Kre9/Knh1-like N-terminal domain-containing protein n=1 Tax=Hohenbuehelia grisea TaxID=104357 RepID=A0ABR3JC37_9AGAR